MLPKTFVALQTPRWTPPEDTVCVQTCKPGDPALQRVARFMNKGARQMSYYAAAKVFGFRARLTAFKSASNIIRIRTK
jgi:hypothetical protein